jgi:serine/threonine protein phosphatase PrpC
MGNTGSHRDTIPEDEVVEANQLGHDAFAVIHQGRRSYQEDAFAYQDFILNGIPTQLYCVLDGHGGNLAVTHCHEKLLANVQQSLLFDSESAEECLKRSFKTTELQLTETFASSPTSSGTPCVSPLATEVTGRVETAMTRPVTRGPMTITRATRGPITGPINKPISSIPPQTEESFSTETESFAIPPPLKLNIPKLPKVWMGDDGSGACALACIKQPHSITIANAGDCRALLIYTDGTFKQLLPEHKAVDLHETERIKEAGLFVENGRVIGELMVSRSIGDFKYKGVPTSCEKHAVTCIPDTLTLSVEQSFSMLVLMTDGIVDGISMEELVYILLNQDTSLAERMKHIVSTCIQPNRSMDNVTLLAIPF